MKNKQIRFISIFLAFMILFQFTPIKADASGITAKAAITMDHDTGDIFFAKNADQMRVPASLTKILTTYIIYEEIAAGNLTKDTMIKVSPAAAKMSTNKGYPMAVPLKSGDSHSVDTFIKLIMIPSASASCYAVAEHISGSEAAFVNRMNKTAKELGMTANFKNSHGAKPHYTTARSVATLVSKFIDKYPDILNYTSLPSFQFNGRTYKILNRFIATTPYKGADGFKTGTIPEAGYCLATTAKINGRRIITVVMNSSSNNNRYNDTKVLLDNGFAEINKTDQVRQKTNLEFINKPDEIRLNSDFNIKVKPNNISKNYHISGGWTIDDKVVKTFNKELFHNNKVMELNHHIENNVKNNVKIGFFLNLPNGNKKEIETIINISDKAPSLYRDTANNWAEKQINALTEKNIINGMQNGKFGSNKKVSKADFITGLGRVIEHLNLDTIENKESVFNDVKTTDYYNKYATWAKEKGIIQGYNNNFSPNKNISREEVAIILDKMINIYELNINEDNNIKFNDLNNVSSWAMTSVENIIKTDLINYGNNNKFNPSNNVYRSDMAYILYQTLNSLEKNVK